MGRKTKIDWCDSTWNPVTGCNHDCEYCYARRQAERFGGFDHDENKEPVGTQLAIGVQELDKPKYIMRSNGLQKAPYPWFFTPTFHLYRLDEPQHWKKPRTIFVCSMADLFGEWVPDEWITETFAACEKAPQHRYLFLTKNPGRMSQLRKKGIELSRTIDWLYGYTIDGIHELPEQRPYGFKTFCSVEPILRKADAKMLTDITRTNWCIVGAETGNRKGKIIPEKAWIDEIVTACKNENVSVFMKESLRSLMGSDFQQEFPWTD